MAGAWESIVGMVSFVRISIDGLVEEPVLLKPGFRQNWKSSSEKPPRTPNGASAANVDAIHELDQLSYEDLRLRIARAEIL